MSESNSGQFVKLVNGPTEPAGSGIGYLLIGGMALGLVALDAYGFKAATDLPPLIGISLAALICVVRFFMLRRRPSHERLSSSGLERVAVCAPASFLAVGLAAYGVYYHAVSAPLPSGPPQMTEEQLETATAAIENYYHLLRARVGAQNNLNERRLGQLKSESATPEEKAEFERLHLEQQELRKLLRVVVAGVRPTDPAPLEETAPPVKREPREEEASLRRRFDAAARLHQQLPDDIRLEVEPPKLDRLPVESIRGGKGEQFIRDTLALSNQALGCWAVPGILELFLIILTLTNRPRD
jgi:hypothetical protein